MIKSKTLLLRFLIVSATLSIGIDTTHYTKWQSQRLEDVCTFDEDLAQKECPSNEECQCVERRAFSIRSREYEGNIIKRADLADGSPCDHRIRKEFIRMSKEERFRYIRAVQSLSTDPRTKERFRELGRLHEDHFCKILHCMVFFLPWHRLLILHYENLLREIEPNVTLAYWDWSMVMAKPFDSNLWDDNLWSFGGSGHGVNSTVTDGPFKEPEWKMVPENDTNSELQLRRDLHYSYPDTFIPSALHMALLFKYEPHEFHKFLTVFQSYHDNVHNVAFGLKSTMSNSFSAWTPEFFLHHTFMDKFWSEWQEKGYPYKYIDYYMKQTRYMQKTQYLPRDLMDLKYQEGNVCVTYEESPNDWIHKMLRNLTVDQLRDIRGLPIILFSDHNVKRWHEIHSVFVNITNHDFAKKFALRNPVAFEELAGLDRQRGFRLRDLIEMSNGKDDIGK